MKIEVLKKSDYPEKLTEISSPPVNFFYIGSLEALSKPCVSIVGSRKATSYGRQVSSMFAGELAEFGITIISGLALGIDSIAHKAALEAGGTTVAVMPCGLDQIYPSSHRNLAIDIVKQSGCLVSEYEKGMPALRQNFIARNRIVSALADAVIITEAAEKSGSLITAGFALEQGKTVFAVPGPITSSTSRGCNNLIKSGALPLTDAAQIIEELGLEKSEKRKIAASSPEEQIIIDIINQGISDGEEIQVLSKLEAALFSQTLTMMELSGIIRPLGNNQWGIC